ncbi:hypothetical protein GPECTOR_11g17 [Gonium pectorale]|uniref:Uncharacterized protein n=1 Tax=Gonium pectorale TaxID=33097 RepID=A0A150GPR2_GONPE|nr:hypothetical protein GPECTOR_11g17 [Gonium pectorale]|eukprot:KXZ51722.1 hypothetical protein GPECTOR_11g17 [Gonium pectorale]
MVAASNARSPPEPSDEAWAERGVYICYGKTDLSYEEAEQLVRQAGLDLTREDFRDAAQVVWAYRSQPPQPPLPIEAASGSRSGGGGGGGDSTSWRLVGYAAADVMLPVTGVPAASVAAAAAAVGAGPGGRRGRRSRAMPRANPAGVPVAPHPAVATANTATASGASASAAVASPAAAATAGGGGDGQHAGRSASLYDKLGLVRDSAAPLVKGPPGRAARLPLQAHPRAASAPQPPPTSPAATQPPGRR